MPEIPLPDQEITLSFHIEPAQAGLYLTLPFEMPANTGFFTLHLDYPTHAYAQHSLAGGEFTARSRLNIIDLGLVAPDGQQVGASGSHLHDLVLSETNASPGYLPSALTPGTWQILVGAYKVAPEGVTVTYTLRFTPKHGRWLIGDLHAHTLNSDGMLSPQGLAEHAHESGLDFLALTDHNQFVTPRTLPKVPDLTIIPGVEWTHYRGHANFLGLTQPYDGPFFTNTAEGVLSRFSSARERGALIVINHPFDPTLPFTFDLEALPFDLLEVWNGPMTPRNLQAVAFWNSWLTQGRKVPIVGGSDYHNDRLALILGGPATCVYAQSNSPTDILQALRQGHSYIVFQADGPRLEMRSGEAILGDSLPWTPDSHLEISLSGLVKGDVLKLVTPAGSQELFTAPAAGEFNGSVPIPQPGFARLELWQSYANALPALPALLSNPIYFD